MNQIINDRNDRTITASPFVMYISVVLLIYILPRFKVSVPYSIAGSAMLLFIPIIWNKDRRLTNYIVVLLFSYVIVAFLGVLVGSYSLVGGLNEAIRGIRFFAPILITIYVLNYCTKKQCQHILIFFSILICFVMYKTSIALTTDQWITRILAKSSALDTPELRGYRLQNIGGFEFSYMIGIVTICLVWSALNSKKRFVRGICLIAAVVCVNYIIQTMYMTLLLLTAFCILLLFIINIKSNYIKLFCIILSISMVNLLPFLFGFLSTMFDNSLLSTKFSQIHDAMIGGGVDSLGSRPEKILFALKSWTEHPILGAPAEDVNAHSLVVSTLVSNGIVGLAVLILLLFLSYNIIINELSYFGVNSSLFIVSFIYVVVLAVLNPIGYVFEITIAAFFIAPLCSIVFMPDYMEESFSG